MPKSVLHDDAMIELCAKILVCKSIFTPALDIDEDGGQEAFLMALRHVVEARGGMAKLQQKQEYLEKRLSNIITTGNPTLKTLRNVISALTHFSSLASI